MHEVVREDDKLFHALVVSITLSKYILHQVHETLGHNITGTTYQYIR